MTVQSGPAGPEGYPPLQALSAQSLNHPPENGPSAGNCGDLDLLAMPVIPGGNDSHPERTDGFQGEPPGIQDPLKGNIPQFGLK